MSELDELIRVGKTEELPGQYLLDAAAAELAALRQRIAELEGVLGFYADERR